MGNRYCTCERCGEDVLVKQLRLYNTRYICWKCYSEVITPMPFANNVKKPRMIRENFSLYFTPSEYLSYTKRLMVLYPQGSKGKVSAYLRGLIMHDIQKIEAKNGKGAKESYLS